jgi:plastocyanin
MQRFAPGRSWQSALTAVGSAALLLSLWGSVAFADATVTMTEGSPTDINTWAFAPAEVTLSVGQAVTWTNSGTQSHSATADNGTAFDTGLVPSGQSKTVTFDTPGSYAYHCTPHPWMKGTITVTAAAAAAPAAPPQAAAPAAAPAAPAAAQAAPTPTPFRFLTPTPVGPRPATGATTTTTPPNAGGVPDGLALLLLTVGASALWTGVRVLRGGRSAT